MLSKRYKSTEVDRRTSLNTILTSEMLMENNLSTKLKTFIIIIEMCNYQ